MSKQYESAYERICAPKNMKQCVVALNNHLQQAKKNHKRKLRQCSKLVFKPFRIWLDHATDRILEILRCAHHAFVDVCHCSFLRTLRSCFARFFLFLGRFVCVGVPQIVSHEYHGEACFIFSAPVERWTYKLGTRKKHEGMGHILEVTKDKQKRGRTCVPLLYFKSLVVGLFFRAVWVWCLFVFVSMCYYALDCVFLSVWQDISLSPR